MHNRHLAEKLVECAQNDLRLRQELAASGALFDGYHPEMEKLHIANARVLESVIEKLGGWPCAATVGAEASEAAWLIVQHAIGLPAFQRAALSFLQSAAASGAVPAWQPAMLDDRIRAFEGRLQTYGTQFDWDENGELSPLPIEKPESVNDRRASVGLGLIEEKTAEMRRRAAREGDRAPADIQKRRQEADRWARKAGWR
jgi:hypothetical protein